MNIFEQLATIAALCITLSYQQSCSTMNNKGIVSHDLAAISGQSQGNCCGICSSTPGCKGYAWNAYNGGTCWLKDGTAPLIDKNGVTVGIIGGGGGGGGTGALVSYNEFANAVINANNPGFPRPTQDQYNAFIKGLPNGQISTKQEAAMALTHFLHESDGLRAKKEYRCLQTGCPNEYVTPGCDAFGQHYFGRGYIQLTWCGNYRAASQGLFNDERLVSNPDMVAEDENVAWNTAFWFWKTNVHSRPGASDGAFGVTTRAINGALECDNVSGQPVARHRFDMYGKIRAAYGLSGPGIERGCYN